MIQSGAPSATCPRVFLSGGWRLLLLVPPLMLQFGASAVARPRMFQSGGRRLLLLVPPQMLPSEAPILLAPLSCREALAAPSCFGSMVFLFCPGCSSPGRQPPLVPGCSSPGGSGSCCLFRPGQSSPGPVIWWAALSGSLLLCVTSGSSCLLLHCFTTASSPWPLLCFSSASSTCVFLLALVLCFFSLKLLGPGPFSASLPLLGLVLLAASLHHGGLMHWTTSQLHLGPVLITAALHFLSLVLISVSLHLHGLALYVASGPACLATTPRPPPPASFAYDRHFPLDAPVRGVGAPPVCSAPDDPVRGARPPLVPGRCSPGAADPPAWSAPVAPVRGVRSPGRSLASSLLRCFSSASPGPPPLCFSSGSWCPPTAGVRLGGRPRPHWLLLGTVSRAVVACVWCALSGSGAPGSRCCLARGPVPCLWPAVCLSGVPPGPILVCRALSGLVALGAPVGFPVAVVPSPTPGALAPGFTGRLRGARGGLPGTGLTVPAAGPCRGRGAGLPQRRTSSGPRDGVVPGGSLRLWAVCAAVVWRVWTQSLTRPVSRGVHRLTGDSAGAPGLFRVDADTSSLGSEDATPGSGARLCVRALLSWFGRAGLPGALWCASPFLWPFCPSSLLGFLRAGVALVLLCVFFCLLSFFLFFFAPSAVVSGFLCFPALSALGLGALHFLLPSSLLVCPPRPPLFLFFFSPPLFFSCALLVFLFSGGGGLLPHACVVPCLLAL